MKWILVLLSCLPVSGFSQTISREKLREYYITMVDHEEARDTIIAKVENLKNRTAYEEAYTGEFIAFKAFKAEGMWNKLRYVLRARSFLNSAVERVPEDPEFHFLRFGLEHYLPSFLGLNKHLQTDLHIVLTHLNFIDSNPRGKWKVIDFILRTNRATVAENKLLQEELKKIKL